VSTYRDTSRRVSVVNVPNMMCACVPATGRLRRSQLLAFSKLLSSRLARSPLHYDGDVMETVAHMVQVDRHCIHLWLWYGEYTIQRYNVHVL
jgi:hypothetical protein